MTDYLIFLIKPQRDANGEALRLAHLAGLSLLAAIVTSAYYRRTN
ncbi:hypothetical protein [Kitasatospora sp. NPDC001683]